jgi:hypothetical protein
VQIINAEIKLQIIWKMKKKMMTGIINEFISINIMEDFLKLLMGIKFVLKNIFMIINIY